MSTTITATLHEELAAIVGADHVSDDMETRRRASVDEAPMSPILRHLLPAQPADLVVYPADAAEAARVVAAASAAGAPVTARGKGTGNYGQAVPLHGGILLDMSRCTAVLEFADDRITAEAGARMNVIEQEAHKRGRQLLMYPSMMQATLGGFLSGGSGGAGSIAHGFIHDGFVLGLDVVYPASNGEIVHVEGEDAAPFLHSYGAVGIILRATVRLEPAQQWQGVYASFADHATALALVEPLTEMEPAPRLVSLDDEVLAAAFPSRFPIADGRSSLRVIADDRVLPDVRELIESHGGTVDAIEAGLKGCFNLSLLSFNHPTWWLIRNEPDADWFHLEVGGRALVERYDEVASIFENQRVHIDGNRPEPHGMVMAPYPGPEAFAAGAARLTELGVGWHSPHHWVIDRHVDRVRAAAATTDPDGILNPGKLVDDPVMLP